MKVHMVSYDFGQKNVKSNFAYVFMNKRTLSKQYGEINGWVPV